MHTTLQRSACVSLSLLDVITHERCLRWAGTKSRVVFAFNFSSPWDKPHSLTYGAPYNLYADAKGLLSFGQANRPPPFPDQPPDLVPTPFGTVYSTAWQGVDFALRSTDVRSNGLVCAFA